MTLLTVVQGVCAVVGVSLPTSVFSNITGNRTMQEMVALANEMAQRIAYDYRDWTRLRKAMSMAGDGLATSFNLPDNYKRMLLTTQLYRAASASTPMRFIPNTDEWFNRRTRSEFNSNGEWTLWGGQLHIAPAPADAEIFYFTYYDKNCVVLASGGQGDAFLSDNDTFALDERLLRLGMIAQWKAQKGSPYQEDLGTFGDALANAMGADSPGPIIIGSRGISSDANVAIPTQTIYVPGGTP